METEKIGPIVEVRQISESDLDRFVEIWNQFSDVLTSSGKQMTFEKAREGFADKMFDYQGVFADGELIGFLLAVDDGNFLWLKHLAVDHDHSGQGYGNQLVDLAKAKSIETERGLRAEVLKENVSAQQFFLSQGFTETGRNRQEGEIIFGWNTNAKS